MHIDVIELPAVHRFEDDVRRCMSRKTDEAAAPLLLQFPRGVDAAAGHNSNADATHVDAHHDTPIERVEGTPRGVTAAVQQRPADASVGAGISAPSAVRAQTENGALGVAGGVTVVVSTAGHQNASDERPAAATSAATARSRSAPTIPGAPPTTAAVTQVAMDGDRLQIVANDVTVVLDAHTSHSIVTGDYGQSTPGTADDTIAFAHDDAQYQVPKQDIGEAARAEASRRDAPPPIGSAGSVAQTAFTASLAPPTSSSLSCAAGDTVCSGKLSPGAPNPTDTAPSNQLLPSSDLRSIDLLALEGRPPPERGPGAIRAPTAQPGTADRPWLVRGKTVLLLVLLAFAFGVLAAGLLPRVLERRSR